MNVRDMANRVTSRVNRNTVAQWLAYAGYDVLPTGKTSPVYATPVNITAQVQALTAAEIEHLDSMNLSPCDRAAYCDANVQAIDREKQVGGDLLIFESATWLVTAILEGWTTAGWCKVALTKQNGG